MERITLDELRILVNPGQTPRVSLYVPLQGAYTASDENAMQLRHALFQAETKLKEFGVDGAVLEALLRPAHELVRSGELDRSTGSKGLAVLAAPGEFHTWRLPFTCESAVDVGTEFHIAPLVRFLNWPLDIRVLALCPTSVRYFRCTRDGLHKLDLPTGTVDCLDHFEGGPDVGRAVRFQTSAGATGATSVVHGQTSFKDAAEPRLQAYVQSIARHIGDSIRRENLPLVLIAVKEIHSIFKDAYTWGGLLVKNGIQSSPAHLSEAEIHTRVMQLPHAGENQELKLARDRYLSAIETHHAGCVLEEIAPAAREGRVDTLIAADGTRVWGLCEEGSQRALVTSATSQAEAVDLIDLAVRETLRHGGRVCVVPRSEVPEQASIIAAYRWIPSADFAGRSLVFREST